MGQKAQTYILEKYKVVLMEVLVGLIKIYTHNRAKQKFKEHKIQPSLRSYK